MMECEEIRDSLSEWMDGELPPERRSSMESHLKVCAACRSELQALQNAAAAVRALPRHSIPQPLWPRLQASLRTAPAELSVTPIRIAPAASTPRRAGPGSWRRPLLSAVASLAVGFLVFLAAQPSFRAPSGSEAQKSPAAGAPHKAASPISAAPSGSAGPVNRADRNLERLQTTPEAGASAPVSGDVAAERARSSKENHELTLDAPPEASDKILENAEIAQTENAIQAPSLGATATPGKAGAPSPAAALPSEARGDRDGFANLKNPDLAGSADEGLKRRAERELNAEPAVPMAAPKPMANSDHRHEWAQPAQEKQPRMEPEHDLQAGVETKKRESTSAPPAPSAPPSAPEHRMSRAASPATRAAPSEQSVAEVLRLRGKDPQQGMEQIRLALDSVHGRVLSTGSVRGQTETASAPATSGQAPSDKLSDKSARKVAELSKQIQESAGKVKSAPSGNPGSGQEDRAETASRSDNEFKALAEAPPRISVLVPADRQDEFLALLGEMGFQADQEVVQAKSKADYDALKRSDLQDAKSSSTVSATGAPSLNAEEEKNKQTQGQKPPLAGEPEKEIQYVRRMQPSPSTEQGQTVGWVRMDLILEPVPAAEKPDQQP